MWICPDKPHAANDPIQRPLDLSFLDEIKESEFTAEGKPDGWRVVWDHDECDLFSRNQLRLSDALKTPIDKDIANIMSLFKDVTLDGEYVTRRTNTEPLLYLFDIYGRGKELFLNVPHIDRRALLLDLFKERVGLSDDLKVRFIPYAYNNFHEFFRLQQKNPIIMEGIVLKKKQSTLTGNRTNRSINNEGWFKVKFR